MKRRLFFIGPTEVFLQPASLAVAAYFLLTGHGLLLAVSTASILLHECAHAAAAAICGKPPAELEITPLGALMRLEDEDALNVPVRLLVLLCGPLASFGLCMLSVPLARHGILPQDVCRLLFTSNLAFLAVNLLPALPLDGGRLLAVLLDRMCRADTRRRLMRGLGTVVGVGLIALNTLMTLCFGGWNLTAAAAGCFLIYAASVSTTSHSMSELRAFMDRKIRLEQRGSLRCEHVAILTDVLLRDALRHLHPRRFTVFNVRERGTLRAVCSVGEEALIAAYLDRPSDTVTQALVTSCNPWID